MEHEPITGQWEPYVVHGTRHPGVFVQGLEENDGTILHARLEEGGYTNPHTHSGIEEITILEGEGHCILNGMPSPVMKGQTIRIPEGAVHQLLNTGTQPLLVRAAFTPPFHLQTTTLI